jgi:site-specific recombinase
MHDGPFVSGDPLGTAVVLIGAVATVFSFVLAFRFTVRPREDSPDHPKRLILRKDR